MRGRVIVRDKPMDIRDTINQHYLTHLGDPFKGRFQALAPEGLPFSVSLYQLPDRIALATNGLSQHCLAGSLSQPSTYSELLLYLPNDWALDELANGDPDWAWPVDWVSRIGARHLADRVWFGPGDLAEDLRGLPGLIQPLIGYSVCLYLTEDTPLGSVTIKDNYRVTFYTLYPLYESEYLATQRHGVRWLVTAFRDAGLPTTTSQLRPSVV